MAGKVNKDTMYAPPLDLSFKCINSMTGTMAEEPRTGLRRLQHTPEGKVCSRVLRLNNNILPDLSGFNEAIDHFIKDTSQLSWIDLSFNDLSTIDNVLTQYKNLRVLYLHGNSIITLGEVDKLVALPNLLSLTLHGNPMENEKGYRNYVMSALPQLKTLDFSAVTKQDRVAAAIWRRGFNQQKRPKRNFDV
ncbi:leucine-rich repeat-containing protein 51 [Huso huso]|uniref:Leucine-rich repeat-containing protein 51 n=1 Tax=Huso huso TaxID=61971 RepID=A0ABR0ZMB9_HUSHU